MLKGCVQRTQVKYQWPPFYSMHFFVVWDDYIYLDRFFPPGLKAFTPLIFFPAQPLLSIPSVLQNPELQIRANNPRIFFSLRFEKTPKGSHGFPGIVEIIDCIDCTILIGGCRGVLVPKGLCSEGQTGHPRSWWDNIFQQMRHMYRSRILLFRNFS